MMIYRILCIFLICTASACMFTPNYELEELYGHWYGDAYQFWINSDHSFRLLLNNGREIKADTFRASSLGGNELEFLKGEKVVHRMIINQVKGNKLRVETYPSRHKVKFLDFEKMD